MIADQLPANHVFAKMTSPVSKTGRQAADVWRLA